MEQLLISYYLFQQNYLANQNITTWSLAAWHYYLVCVYYIIYIQISKDNTRTPYTFFQLLFALLTFEKRRKWNNGYGKSAVRAVFKACKLSVHNINSLIYPSQCLPKDTMQTDYKSRAAKIDQFQHNLS